MIKCARSGYRESGTDRREAGHDQEWAYHITVEMLDGIEGGNQGVMVLRDGTKSTLRLLIAD